MGAKSPQKRGHCCLTPKIMAAACSQAATVPLLTFLILGESVNENEIVTSSEMVVGPVHRRDVDSTFTCLASNSNMTQASRATVVLQMNRK